MQEKGQVDAAVLVTQVMAHVHELIVVDPDEGVGAALRDHSVRELAVDLDIRVPVLRIELGLGLEVVEQRPDALVRIAVVVLVDLLLAQSHRVQLVAGASCGSLKDLLYSRRLLVDPRPADPNAAAVS